MASTKCVSPKCAKITFWVSAVVLAISVAVLALFPSLYKDRLKKETALTEGSMVTDVWKDIPLPIYEKLYFFNITNGEEFLANKEPLNVSEVGPYTYQAKWVKHNPVWNDNGTVSYRELRTYHFVRDLSSGSEDDSVYTLNGPMVIAADILKNYNIVFRIAASAWLGFEKEQIVTRKTIRELGYGGYYDPIIKMAPLLKPDIPFKGRFLWLVDKNATNDGVFNVFTGKEDPAVTGLIDKWNGQDRLNYWKGDTCNMLNGTSIETGPPLPNDPVDYTFYQTIFCRSISLNFTGDVDHYGVQTKRFVTTPEIFANSSVNDANKCFELEKERPSGVLEVRPCQFGAPVLLSFPHFHMSDPSYLSHIEGLHPSAEEHGSYMDVEPITGITMDVAIRFQVNLQMEKVRGILQFDNVPEGVFPVFWAAIEIHVTEDWADYFKNQLTVPKIVVYTVGGVLLVASLVLVIWSLVYISRHRRRDDEDPLIDVKEEHKGSLDRRTIVPPPHPDVEQDNPDMTPNPETVKVGV